MMRWGAIAAALLGSTVAVAQPGPGGLTWTDGTNAVQNPYEVLLNGGTVSSPSPGVVELTISGGGSGCTPSGGTAGQLLLYGTGGTCNPAADASVSAGVLSLGASGTLGAVTMGNATTGTITIEPMTGALGTVTVLVPAANDTLVNLTSTQTLSNKTLASPVVTGAFTATGLVTNADLANSTISGIALGNNLDTLTFGTHLASGGSSYNGSAGITITSDATNANTASTIVARDGSGNFTAGTITASLTGTASAAPLSGITGFGTGVAPALGTAVGTAGGPVVLNGAGGTPSSITLTNATGTAASLIAGTATVANGLKSATTTVVVSAATAPTNGQVLTASSSTAAAWATPGTGAWTLTDGTNSVANVATETVGPGLLVGGSGGAATLNLSAPSRTVTSSPTVLSTDMGGFIYSNVTGGGTLTIPAISSTVFPVGTTLQVTNYSASTEAVSTTPTVNAGGGCITATGIPAGDTWYMSSNGGSIDCIQTVSASSGGSSAFNSITSGTNTTATMTVGAGGSITFTSTGVVNANELGGVALLGGTLTNTDFCTYANSGTLLNCNTGSTGSGNVVLVTSPTLVTPALGTPSAINLANGTNLPNSSVNAATLGTGTSVSLAAPRQYYVCTSTCTVTPPVPAAGYEFCVMNDDNVSTVITMAAIGSSARYENTARTAYGTAGTGTFVSGGAVGDKVCLLGRDSTHYLTTSFNGTWVAN